MARRAADGNHHGAVRLAARLVSVALIGGAAISIGMAVVGSRVLSVFIGSGYSFELGLALAVVGVESCLWAGVAVRTLGVTIGRPKIVLTHWLVGALLFGCAALVSPFGQGRLIAAPLIAATTVAGLALWWLWALTRVTTHGISSLSN